MDRQNLGRDSEGREIVPPWAFIEPEGTWDLEAARANATNDVATVATRPNPTAHLPSPSPPVNDTVAPISGPTNDGGNATGRNDNDTGAIVGAVLGSLTACVILALAVLFYRRRRQRLLQPRRVEAGKVDLTEDRGEKDPSLHSPSPEPVYANTAPSHWPWPGWKPTSGIVHDAPLPPSDSRPQSPPGPRPMSAPPATQYIHPALARIANNRTVSVYSSEISSDIQTDADPNRPRPLAPSQLYLQSIGQWKPPSRDPTSTSKP